MMEWFKRKLGRAPTAEVIAQQVQARPQFEVVPLEGTPWRDDPALRDRLHDSFLDDVQVLVHDGEPRRTERGGEECWVRITRAIQGPPRLPDLKESVVYAGKLLNQPSQLTSVRQGDPIYFVCGGGLEFPLHVTEQYLLERPSWSIDPCTRCGMSECLDPPSVMIHTRFPNAMPGMTLQAFSAFCAACGGVQVLAMR